jgi:hypothetical protein
MTIKKGIAMNNWNIKWYIRRGRIFFNLLVLIALILILQLIVGDAGVAFAL